MSAIAGPDQIEKYSGPLTFIGEDLDAIVARTRSAFNGLDTRVTTLEGGTFSGDIAVAGDAAITGDLSVTGNLAVTGTLTIGGSTVYPITSGAFPTAPTITSTGGGAATYSSQLGRYVRQGPLVHWWVDITLATTGTLAAGNVRISNLPFTAQNTLSMTSAVGYFASMTTSVVWILAHVSGGSTNVDLYRLTAAATVPPIMSVADLSGTTRIMAGGTYETSA